MRADDARACCAALSWPELRHHPWRNVAALLAVMLGVALAFSVHLINAVGAGRIQRRGALGQRPARPRAARRRRGGFDEALYARVAADPQVALASPVLELDTLRARRAAAGACRCACSASTRWSPAPLAPALLPRPGRRRRPRSALLDPDARVPQRRSARSAAAAGAERTAARCSDRRGAARRAGASRGRRRAPAARRWR